MSPTPNTIGCSNLFLLDHWVDGHAPSNLWPDAFVVSPTPFSIVKDIAPVFMIHSLQEVDPFIDDYIIRLGSDSKDLKD